MTTAIAVSPFIAAAQATEVWAQENHKVSKAEKMLELILIGVSTEEALKEISETGHYETTVLINCQLRARADLPTCKSKILIADKPIIAPEEQEKLFGLLKECGFKIERHNALESCFFEICPEEKPHTYCLTYQVTVSNCVKLINLSGDGQVLSMMNCENYKETPLLRNVQIQAIHNAEQAYLQRTYTEQDIESICKAFKGSCAATAFIYNIKHHTYSELDTTIPMPAVAVAQAIAKIKALFNHSAFKTTFKAHDQNTSYFNIFDELNVRVTCVYVPTTVTELDLRPL